MYVWLYIIFLDRNINVTTTYIYHFASLSPALHPPHCVPFGVTVHRYIEGRIWNTQGAPDLSPDFGSIPEYLSSYVVLFVFCFSTGKAMLAINKGLQRSVFFSLLRFPLLIFVTSSVVWLYSLSLSHFLSLLWLVTNSISR